MFKNPSVKVCPLQWLLTPKRCGTPLVSKVDCNAGFAAIDFGPESKVTGRGR